MYLIVGLGNPEKDYAKSRHNLGFDVINALAKKYEINLTRKKFNGYYGAGTIEDEKVILVKPQTFMNNSGESAKEFVDFYKEPLDNLMVIFDDMDTEAGTIRVRAKGGPGSHNGMKSMVNCLNSENFARIRIGIGRPVGEYDRIDYVIGQIDGEEKKILEKGQDEAVEAIKYWIKNGIDNTMNTYN